MAVDQEPFTDVRVRQAMRLIVDRHAMVDQVLGGYGRVANDLYSPLDAAYIGDDLPQREQDIEAANGAARRGRPGAISRSTCSPRTTPRVLPEMAQAFADDGPRPASPSTPQVSTAARTGATST